MADRVLREILSEIRSARFYAVQADEASDVSNNKQMYIAIRWVDKEYNISEQLIGLVHVPQTDANTHCTFEGCSTLLYPTTQSV